MNNLNSVLIEGTVINDSELIDNTICKFVIASNRYYNTDNRMDLEVTQVPVEIKNKTSCVICNKISKGKNVRIVGRLKKVSNELVIEVEHIEFK